jgi:transposase
MGLADSQGPASSETPPPRWKVEGDEIPLESLETGPLPDGTQPDDIKWYQNLVRSLARELRLTRERLAQELSHRYGRHSEKRPGGDKNGADGQANASTGSGAASGSNSASDGSTTKTTDAEGSKENGGQKPGHGRRPIPPGLEREEQPIPLDDARCKRCKGTTHRLQKVESYRYHYYPGRLVVRVLVRWRCVCDDPTCDGPFRIAKMPPEPIPKGRATAGFLAHLFVTKFADHCPLYRFRKILLRQRVDLPLSTLVDYCKKSADLLKPLWELMRKRILESEIIQTDDTHVQVRLPRKKGVLKGHLWAYRGDDEHPYVVFEFTPNWEAKATQDFLGTFEGFIQADGYKGYDELFKNPKRIEVGCMAHARRRWVKAETSSPHVAKEALKRFGQLYAIEDECKQATPEARRAIRQERSAPILDALKLWAEEQRTRALPKSPVTAAVEYMQNQWVALTRFLEDGRLSIDNNAVERDLRAVALGRKNWMAAGSEVGGETAAIGFTMIASALACGINSVEWLADVLERIVTCPAERLHELLPDQWKAARDASDRARHTAASGEQEAPGAVAAPSATDDACPDETGANPAPASPAGDGPASTSPPDPTDAEGHPSRPGERERPAARGESHQPEEASLTDRPALRPAPQAAEGPGDNQAPGPPRTARAPP